MKPTVSDSTTGFAGGIQMRRVVGAILVITGSSLVGTFGARVRGIAEEMVRRRLVHFLALAYVISHSGLTQLLRRTFVFSPLALIGRHSLPVFATGCVLVAIGEVMVETRPEDFSYPLTLSAAFVAVGILVHYAVARILAARRGVKPQPVLAIATR